MDIFRAYGKRSLPYPSRLEIQRAAVGVSGGQFPVAPGRWERNKIFSFQRPPVFARPILWAQKVNVKDNDAERQAGNRIGLPFGAVGKEKKESGTFSGVFAGPSFNDEFTNDK